MKTIYEEIKENSLASIGEKDRESVRLWLLEKKAGGLSENTIRTYYTVARALSDMSSKPLIRCTREDILGILAEAQDRFENPAIYKQVLVDVLRSNGRERVVSRLPRNNRRKARRDPATILNLKDLQRLLAVTRDVRDKAILGIFWDTGARCHEVASIRVGDIQKFHKKIDGKTYLSVYFRKSKTQGEERRVPLLVSSGFVRTWLHAHPHNEDPGASLFVSKRRADAPALSSQRLRDIVRLAGKKAGIEKPCHPHAFRHAKATILKVRGTSDDAIRTFMGWTRDSTMPNRYISREDDEKMDEVIQKLGYEKISPAPVEKLEPEDLLPVSQVDIDLDKLTVTYEGHTVTLDNFIPLLTEVLKEAVQEKVGK